MGAAVDFDGQVNLFHFSLCQVVGKGAFGKVRVVKHKRTKESYALKYINKPQCVRMKAVKHIIQERLLLEGINHPYIANLRYAFQDDENCFFVLDLMLGGDLRFHLERTGSLSEELVRFYVAQLSLALEYLHSQGIVHRDIKPDNILLDAQGNAHLTDFNVAIQSKELIRGMAGSIAYMAPEILIKQGYSHCVDWWSLGVCAYELMFGRRPFTGRTNDELSHSIRNSPLKFPEDSRKKCSTEGKQALQEFLERDITKRLGCRPYKCFGELQKHSWFKSINWEILECKQETAPFIPDCKKGNFDVSYEVEEALLESKPLKAKERKAKNQENLSDELKELEERFKPYDYAWSQRPYYSIQTLPLNL
ncbi:agc yank protein kinase [Moniliophthora roreri]|nr:agc yank protein kinase [Moniliophthora roreri]